MHARMCACACVRMCLLVLQAGEAFEGTTASLVFAAARPWSRQTHELFPTGARARAMELLLLGHRLSRESRFVGVEVSLLDAWMEIVLPHAVQRS